MRHKAQQTEQPIMSKAANHIADAVLNKMAAETCAKGMPCEPAGEEQQKATPNGVVLTKTESKIAPVTDKQQEAQKIAEYVLTKVTR